MAIVDLVFIALGRPRDQRVEAREITELAEHAGSRMCSVPVRMTEDAPQLGQGRSTELRECALDRTARQCSSETSPLPSSRSSGV
jgi:hypothetical protein